MHIFVGNLAFSATEDEVRQVFETYRDVASVRLLTDRDTGRPRGFGFVEMPDAREARADDCRAQWHHPGRATAHGQRGAATGRAGWAAAGWATTRPPVVSGMSAPRRLLGGPAGSQRQTARPAARLSL